MQAKTPEPKVGGTIDYALGQIDTKLATITQTLAEDRLSDAQFRTWVRDQMEKMDGRIDHLESAEDRVKGRNEAYGFVAKAMQFVAGAFGGALAIVLERLLFGGHPRP